MVYDKLLVGAPESFGGRIMNILFCGYREWANTCLSGLSSSYPDADFFLVTNRRQLGFYKGSFEKFDMIFFVGWSWKVPLKLIETQKCICIHPSPLPKYRGGSPIQNQIIAGEISSRVTAFIMNEEIDAGPVLHSVPYSLRGELAAVLNNIAYASIECLSKIIDFFKVNKKLTGTPQDNSKATYFPRRLPEQSEIKLEDFKSCKSRQIYDKIRSLQSPYPCAYVVCGDGKKLFLVAAELENEENDNCPSRRR